MDNIDDITVSICWGATRIGVEQHKLGIEIGPGLGQNILRQVDHTKSTQVLSIDGKVKRESGVDLQPQQYVKEPLFQGSQTTQCGFLVSSSLIIRARGIWVAERFKNT